MALCFFVFAALSLSVGSIFLLIGFSDVLFAIHHMIPLDLLLGVALLTIWKFLQETSRIESWLWKSRVSLLTLFLLQPLALASLTYRNIQFFSDHRLTFTIVNIIVVGGWIFLFPGIDKQGKENFHLLLIFYGMEVVFLDIAPYFTWEPFWRVFIILLSFLFVALWIEQRIAFSFPVQAQFALIQGYCIWRSCLSLNQSSGKIFFFLVCGSIAFYNFKERHASWLLQQLICTGSGYFFLELVKSDYSVRVSGILLVGFGLICFYIRDHWLQLLGIQLSTDTHRSGDPEAGEIIQK